MTRRERLMASLAGQPVDRPAVSFYEINGIEQDPTNPDPFNIFTHPSWQPLLDLARVKSDIILMRGVALQEREWDPLRACSETEEFIRDGSRHCTHTLRAGNRTLVSRTRREPDMDTIWTEEHYLKDIDDLNAFLSLPFEPEEHPVIDPTRVLETEAMLGDRGIVMLDTADPVCMAAALFDMGTYTVVALTEQTLFRQLLERFMAELLPKIKAASKAMPGRLWRIYGPEYATPPYLPPTLFREYVCAYVKPMIDAIHEHGGYARVHCHGRIKDVLDDIVGMGADAIDPIEPPPQGDVELSYVRSNYGKQLTLFGNLEVSDIELLPSARFAETVKRSIEEGSIGEGRGFVLMPSSCPAGRVLSTQSMKNYETIITVLEAS